MILTLVAVVWGVSVLLYALFFYSIGRRADGITSLPHTAEANWPENDD